MPQFKTQHVKIANIIPQKLVLCGTEKQLPGDMLDVLVRRIVREVVEAAETFSNDLVPPGTVKEIARALAEQVRVQIHLLYRRLLPQKDMEEVTILVPQKRIQQRSVGKHFWRSGRRAHEKHVQVGQLFHEERVQYRSGPFPWIEKKVLSMFCFRSALCGFFWLVVDSVEVDPCHCSDALHSRGMCGGRGY